MARRRRRQSGFTYVELLTAALLIAIVEASGLPAAVEALTDIAPARACEINRRNLRGAVEIYRQEVEGRPVPYYFNREFLKELVDRGYLARIPACERGPAGSRSYVLGFGGGDVACTRCGDTIPSRGYYCPSNPLGAKTFLLHCATFLPVLGCAWLYARLRRPGADGMEPVASSPRPRHRPLDPMELEVDDWIREHRPVRQRPRPATPLEGPGCDEDLMELLVVEAGAHPRCPVCAHPLAGVALLCSDCGTPHHGECFHYNRGCGIFACGSRVHTQTTLAETGADPHNEDRW